MSKDICAEVQKKRNKSPGSQTLLCKVENLLMQKAGVVIKYRRKVPGEGYEMNPHSVFVRKQELLSFAERIADEDIKIYDIAMCDARPPRVPSASSVFTRGQPRGYTQEV